MAHSAVAASLLLFHCFWLRHHVKQCCCCCLSYTNTMDSNSSHELNQLNRAAVDNVISRGLWVALGTVTLKRIELECRVSETWHCVLNEY